MTEKAHSPLGPSSAERWLNCTASVKATEGVPETPSRYAAEGTIAHEIAEESFATGTPPQMFLGQVRQCDGFGIEVDKEMVEGVHFFLDHMNDLPVGDDFNESRVSYEQYVPGGFGTLDRARVVGDTGYIRDLKYGKGVQVFATDNAQLKLYALGWYLTYGWLYPDIKTFNLGVVQPRLDHVDEWSISLDDLLKWAEYVAIKAAETETEDAVFVAGSHCRFCRIRSTCVTRAESVFNTVLEDFGTIDNAIEQTKTLTRSQNMTNEQVAKALCGLPQIRAWCKDLEAHAMSQVQHNQEVGGWYLTEGRANRQFGKPLKEVIELAFKHGVVDPKVLLEEPALLSPAKAEKALGKKHPLFSEPGLIDKPKGKPTLAPPGDGRPPMKVNASDDFTALEDC